MPRQQRVFRSLKTEWIPTTGYMTDQEAQRDISLYLINHYNWIRPINLTMGWPQQKLKENSKPCPG
jgi:putative transposase